MFKKMTVFIFSLAFLTYFPAHAATSSPSPSPTLVSANQTPVNVTVSKVNLDGTVTGMQNKVISGVQIIVLNGEDSTVVQIGTQNSESPVFVVNNVQVAAAALPKEPFWRSDFVGPLTPTEERLRSKIRELEVLRNGKAFSVSINEQGFVFVDIATEGGNIWFDWFRDRQVQ